MRIKFWIAGGLIFLIPFLTALAGQNTDLQKGLVAHFGLHDGQGRVATNQSDPLHGGAIFGALWVSTDRGAALDFDGSREWADCGDEPATRLPGPLSVSAWVRPLTVGAKNIVSRGDWSLSCNEKGQPTFTARPAKNQLWDSTQTISANDPLPANEWTLLTAVYDTDAKQIQLFVNEKLAATDNKPDGAVGGRYRSKLIIGGSDYTGLIADVRLYNRPLMSEDVRLLFEHRDQDVDVRLESKAFRIGLRLHYLFEHQAVLSEVYLRNTSANVKINRLEAELVRSAHNAANEHDNKVVGKTKLEGHDLRYGDLSISTAEIPPGEYLLRVSAFDAAGKLADQRTEAVTIPDAPWWRKSPAKNIESKVFAPWTPLKMERDHDAITSIACWGRSYDFSGVIFPKQIRSDESQLLSQPIQLKVRINRQDRNWTLREAKITQQTDAKIAWTSKLTCENLNAEVKATMEYDGMLWFDVTIDPSSTAKVDSSTAKVDAMWLEIPLAKEQASLYYFMRDSRLQGPGAIPPTGITRPFNQAVWIGNEHRGLQWFAESTQDWIPTKSDHAIQILPQDDQVVLRTQLIDEPVVLDSAANASAAQRPQLKYQFGLQATPVRPVEKTAWDYRTVGATEYNDQYVMLDQTVQGKPILDYYKEKGVKTVFLTTSWTDVFSYPLNIGHTEELHRMTRECHQRGIQVIVYFGLELTDAAPEFPTYLDDFAEWTSPRQEGGPFPYSSYADNMPPGRTQIAYEPCIGSEWRNFLLAGAQRLMDEFDIDGFYLDGVGLGRECYNPHHGCGYQDDHGSSVPTIPLLAGRDFMRRLYEIVKSHKPDGQIQLHPGSAWFGPVMGWSTLVWDGETILGDNQSPTERKSAFLTDYLTPEMFRTQYMGHPWGAAGEFLSYYIPQTYSEVLALTLPHDILIRPNGTGFRVAGDVDEKSQDLDIASALWHVGETFGRRDARWLPYWENAKYVRLTGDKTVASLYKHKSNGVLAVVSNLAKVSQDVHCKFDLQALDLPQKTKVYDAINEQPLTMTNGEISLKLPPLGWKLIRIAP